MKTNKNMFPFTGAYQRTHRVTYRNNDFIACLAAKWSGVSWLYVSPYDEFGSRAFRRSELLLYNCNAAYSSPFWRCLRNFDELLPMLSLGMMVTGSVSALGWEAAAGAGECNVLIGSRVHQTRDIIIFFIHSCDGSISLSGYVKKKQKWDVITTGKRKYAPKNKWV